MQYGPATHLTTALMLFLMVVPVKIQETDISF